MFPSLPFTSPRQENGVTAVLSRFLSLQQVKTKIGEINH